MKQLLFLFVLFIPTGCFGQQTTRELKTVTFSGNGYKLGLQHGKRIRQTSWEKMQI
jgi:isopenicillin-N N-acyltransferase-like protein